MASRKKTTSTPARAQVALLRGINVGGKNKLPMKDLAAMFEELGCTEVRTYIQSGNVVFRASPAFVKRAPNALADAIDAHFGLTVPVVVRTAAELTRIARDNPFLRAGAQAKELHVGFLVDRPPASRIKALDPKRSPPDEFAVRGGEIYLRCPNGIGRTKLTSAYLDSKLGTICTVRNWNTVTKLIELTAS